MKAMFSIILLIFCVCTIYSQEKARLSVSGDSSSILVYVDSSFIGTTPIDGYVISSGKHILHFVSPKPLNWYQTPVIETVTVGTGEHLKRTVGIPSRGYMPQNIPSPWQSVTLKDSLGKIPVTALEGKVVPNNLPLYLTTAGAIVSGGLAAYFKIQADKEYDDYQYTGEQASLDRVKRFDLYAGIALGACEINLVALTYLLLSR